MLNVNGSSIIIGKMLNAISNNVVYRSVLGKSFTEENGKSKTEKLTK